ncbi:hypothetical protein D3H55_22495 [Bacillus salacetis]|uniref:Uncharacterized protein n=1 Tax=Bacillus salacetis TaxID=2315464 RepID=A0A3A1QNZ4_9BACI|nr:hypothetical protein D3H55_22495 [Bacillus salacetis]
MQGGAGKHPGSRTSELDLQGERPKPAGILAYKRLQINTLLLEGIHLITGGFSLNHPIIRLIHFCNMVFTTKSAPEIQAKVRFPRAAAEPHIQGKISINVYEKPRVCANPGSFMS